MKFSIISVISGVSGDSGESTWPEKLRIDEKMVPFKGKSGLKQYNLQKPNKWGYKLYVLSGIDRLIFITLKFILVLLVSALINLT